MPSSILLASLLALGGAGQARFDDVIRHLRNPEPRARLNAVKVLREARHPEAIVPMAALVNDPLDPIQLEAIAAELSFFLIDDVPARRRLGFIEVRNRGTAATAFELGRLAAWPRPAPRELVAALLQAVDDENPRVRVEAMYAAGVVARPPLAPEAEQQLVKALDHYDPAIRAAAARVAGRLEAKATFGPLMKAVGDSSPDVRHAAMRSLGLLRDDRAVTALTEQFAFYGKGEGAWSALDALARIAHASSVPLFTTRLADRDPNLRRAAAEGLGRAGQQSAIEQLEAGAGTDSSAAVRAAMLYALQKLGRNSTPRLIGFLDDGRTTLQVQEYFLELGAAAEPDLLPGLKDPAPAIRAAVADVLGEIGGDASLAALRDIQDRNKDVVEAATRGMERIRLRRSP